MTRPVNMAELHLVEIARLARIGGKGCRIEIINQANAGLVALRGAPAPTPKQKRALDFIVQYYAREGSVPTFDEIAIGLGHKSKGAVHRLVHGMAERGLLNLGRRGAARSYTITHFSTPEEAARQGLPEAPESREAG